MESDTFVRKGGKVELARDKWKLKPCAVQHIFPNILQLLVSVESLLRRKQTTNINERVTERTTGEVIESHPTMSVPFPGNVNSRTTQHTEKTSEQSEPKVMQN